VIYIKNYKIVSSAGLGMFGKRNYFKEQIKESLINMGFNYDELCNKYSKTYWCDYSSLTLCLFLHKNYIYFYKDRFLLPCELDETDSKIVVTKTFKEDLKKLKEIGCIK
jgi:hypothetical protein